MELLRSWVLGMTAAAIVCGVALLLTPEGKVKAVVHLVCGAVMAAALLLPLLELDVGEYGLNLARYRANAAALTADAETTARNLNRSIIEEELEAYILDKAAALSAPMDGVQVQCRWSTEGFWYPESAALQGPYHEGLSRLIEAELGIPARAQTWRSNEEP